MKIVVIGGGLIGVEAAVEYGIKPENQVAIVEMLPAIMRDCSDSDRIVYSQMIAGRDAATFGEAKNSWLTGTAAWAFVSVSQYILGIVPTLDGLQVDPCIPADWKGFPRRASSARAMPGFRMRREKR